MKSKDIKGLAEKTTLELKSFLSQQKRELNKLEMDLALKKLKNIKLITVKKKDIARIKTIIREKELLKGAK